MKENSIPKIIHYCWFGNKIKPKYVSKYIETWKKNMPDYQIIEWNESNFDINFCKFTKEAYSMKKYAFVSDVARLYALYNCGGFYLDTDVKVIKSFDNFITNQNCIFGFEVENKIATSFMACTKHNEFIHKFISIYLNRNFINEDNSLNMVPNVEYLTELLSEKGLVLDGTTQKLENKIQVYSVDYFSPYDYINCVNDMNDLTYCVHFFKVSWLNKNALIKKKIKTVLVKLIGRNNLIKLRKIIRNK